MQCFSTNSNGFIRIGRTRLSDVAASSSNMGNICILSNGLSVASSNMKNFQCVCCLIRSVDLVHAQRHE